MEEVPLVKRAFADPLIAIVAAMVVEDDSVLLPELANVRLLKVVVAVPPMVCAPDALKFIVLPVFVKVPPLFAQFPATLCV